MKTFNNDLYGAILGETILRHTDNLSSTLQLKTLSAAEGQQVAMMTIATLTSLRSDISLDLFWDKINIMASQLKVNEPQLPRCGKLTKNIDDGLSHVFPPDSKAHYKQCYYEAMDLIFVTIHEWFIQVFGNTFY